jgi:hypothetical protein
MQMMKIKPFLFAAVLAVMIMPSLYSQVAFKEGDICTVDVLSALNLREQPDKKSRSLASLSGGQMVRISEDSEIIDSIDGVQSNWYRVDTRNGITGYVFGGFLRKAERFSADMRIKDEIWTFDNPSHRTLEATLAIEKKQMKLQGNVERQGNYLLITLQGGRKISFVNPKGGDGIQRYIYREYISAIDCHVLAVELYEGGYALLVNAKSGVQLKVPSFLYVVSPDNTRIALVREYSYFGGEAGITIVKISRDSPVVEYQTDSSFLPVDCEWVNDNAIKITAKTDESENDSYCYTVMMKKNGAKWSVEK